MTAPYRGMYVKSTNTNLSAFRFCLAVPIIFLRGRIFKRGGEKLPGFDRFFPLPGLETGILPAVEFERK